MPLHTEFCTTGVRAAARKFKVCPGSVSDWKKRRADIRFKAKGKGVFCVAACCLIKSVFRTQKEDLSQGEALQVPLHRGRLAKVD